MAATRLEKDSMGEVEVPVDALWGPQTQRAVNNFPVSGLRMPRVFIRSLGLIKSSAARVSGRLGELDLELVEAIAKAADEVANGELDRHFPVDVFQTGSGTSSNMNANEVIATRAAEMVSQTVHPNDHVNLGQSSNDVVPTAIQIASALGCHEQLLPALDHLRDVILKRAQSLRDVVKTGRTHLMDAMPITFEQELLCWAEQVASAQARIRGALSRTLQLPIGGTAVGTGINAHPEFSERMCAELSRRTALQFVPHANLFEGISTQDGAVELSGQLKTLAVSLCKIANDLRWMNSGPLAGLAEIRLPELQPGSSIMPGKVNPVVPEAVVMVCAQVIGNDATITVAGQAGNFQLNVMLPVIAYNLSQSIELLAHAGTLLADSAIAGFEVNKDRLREAVDRNPILVTALNSVIGYDRGAAIAKRAYREGRPVLDIAIEDSGLGEAELRELLDPLRLTNSRS